MSMMRRRAARRSCLIHGDNGCEIQGEAGPRERAQDQRQWRTDVDELLAEIPDDDSGDDPWGGANLEPCPDTDPCPACALRADCGLDEHEWVPCPACPHQPGPCACAGGLCCRRQHGEILAEIQGDTP